MHRREFLNNTTGAAVGLGLSAFPLGWTAHAGGETKKLLLFTKSAGFQHGTIRRRSPDQLSHTEKVVTELGQKHGFEVTATKDGRVFVPGEIEKFDAFFFYTTGDLTKEGGDMTPPMPVEGKKAFLDAIHAGKGFIGSHCASDTFHSPGYGSRDNRFKNQPWEERDPYIQMLGGEFISHGRQQKAWMRVVGPKFPGAKNVQDFQLHEEWYSLKNFTPNLHVILAQDSAGMREAQYKRPLYPATWARAHGAGRVFYTSMGHREDVWTNPKFQEILLGGIAWALGNVEADVTPNMDKVTPGATQLQNDDA